MAQSGLPGTSCKSLYHTRFVGNADHPSIARKHRHVVLKIGTYSSLIDEVKVLRHINTIEASGHLGATLVRRLLDEIEIEEGGAKYLILVHEPLAVTIASLRSVMADNRFPEPFLRRIIRYVLCALDYLHRYAGVVHTGMFEHVPRLGVYNNITMGTADIQEKNILFGLDSSSAIQDCEDFEQRQRR